MISDAMLTATKINKKLTFRTLWGCLWLVDIEKLQMFDDMVPDRIDHLVLTLEELEARRFVDKYRVYHCECTQN